MSKLLPLLLYFIFLHFSCQVKGLPGRRDIVSQWKLPGDETTNVTNIIRSLRGKQINDSDRIYLDDEHDVRAANYLNSSLSSRLIPTAYLVTILIGVPSNVIIMKMLCSKIKTFSSAILYMSLAVSDLLTLLTLTLKVHYYYNGSNWIFGETLCRVVTASFYGNIYCSIYMHMCLSFRRYMAVAHPFMYKNLPRFWCSMWITLIACAVLLIAMVPELLVRQSYNIHQLNATTCHDIIPTNMEYYNFLLYYKLGLTCWGFFIPFMVTIFSYVSIIRKLNKSHFDWMSYIMISSLVFAIFLICFTPSNVFHFVHYINLRIGNEDSFYIYYSTMLCLCSLHCSLDPFLFFLMARTTGSGIVLITHKEKDVQLKDSVSF
uniref:Coagulation factor II thrombin receptor like 2 n=1 Tax=Paramormyrops kingsleyae TaxID=1676925 RepID=A0A3B3R2C9_9TELE|nr:proteinase-activated receptor 3-like isoform X1 [Paramormyrops kingsleyae]